ncbi:MAG: hypothetical protein ACREQJ_13180, partial [Candidatus Binatia bacterium]
TELAREALELARRDGGIDTAEHCEILLALGEAQRRAGRGAETRETFRLAADIARRIAARDLFARAVLGFGMGAGGVGYLSGSDLALLSLLEEALRVLGDERSVLRALVMARLAVELYYTTEKERRTELAREALELARSFGDRRAQIVALYSQDCIRAGPDSEPADRLQVARELITLADEAGDLELAFRARHLHLAASLEVGDIQAVDFEIDACAQLATDLRQPLYAWQVAVFRAMRSLLAGDSKAAARLAMEARALGAKAEDRLHEEFFGAQLSSILWLEGRLAEIEAQVRGFAERDPWVPAWRASLAYLYSELGRETEARIEFDTAAAMGFTKLRRDATWLDAMLHLSLACAFLRDETRAKELLALVAPYGERYVVVTSGLQCFGSAALMLGVLHATLRQWDEAERHFEAAFDRNARMGAKPFAALTLLH